MRKWYVAYFYNGYLKELNKAFERHQNTLFKDVVMWYPLITEIYIKDGGRIDKEVPIFDNYVLFEFEEDSLVWVDILKRTPIIKFLKGGSNYPIPLPDDQIEHIKRISSRRKPVTDYTKLISKKVEIIGGPFKGMIGICEVLIKGRYKARVSINIHNVVERKVEINLEHLQLFE